MPSIQDVADQINAKLDAIVQNTSDAVAVGNGIRTDLGVVDSKLDRLDIDLQAGVSELSNGLFAIWEAQKATNAILDYQSAQNDTVICLIENTNDLLCGMTRKLTRQLELGEQLVASVKRVEGIIERSEPAAAADFDRFAALQRELAKCCPPDPVPPERCPEGCSKTKPRPYHPKGQDWKPTPPPKPIG